jgi:isopentenyl-diphosphate Delta-isomerase
MEEQVVLVDERDNPIGVDGKMAVHRSGKLHRAISVFVFDDDNRLLLQKRASTKYHSGSLWSNTCCSHPRPEEDSNSAARRRLREEMGIECELLKAFSFVYHATLNNCLVEHEYDHVYFGRYDGVPVPNRDEADDWQWMELAKLNVDVKRNPNTYSFWLAACLDKVVAYRADQNLR